MPDPRERFLTLLREALAARTLKRLGGSRPARCAAASVRARMAARLRRKSSTVTAVVYEGDGDD